MLLAGEANVQGDIGRGKKHAETGLGLARKLDDDELVAVTLVAWASLAEGLGHVDEAWTLSQESLALLHKLGRQKNPEYALNLNNSGYLAWLRGDLKTAQTSSEEAIVVAGDLQNLFLACAAQDNPSVVMLDFGDLVSAQALACQALEYRWVQNDPWGMVFSLENLACLSVEQQDVWRAARLWGMAEKLREEIHAPMVSSWQTRQERFIAKARRPTEGGGFACNLARGKSDGARGSGEVCT